MAQRPKTEVREAILREAAEAFARDGFQRATLADIALRAGTSIGNLYKYFANKDELFEAFLPRDFAAALVRRVRAQLEALRAEPDAFSLDASHPYRRAAEELLRFTIEHRARVVFLLLRAAGTEHERFPDRTVRLLVALALKHAEGAYPGFVRTPARKRALTRIYAGFLSALAAILAEERSEGAIRDAVAMQTAYHLVGLEAFFLRARPTVAAKRAAR